MSHVVSIRCKIKDLDALEKAAKSLGLDFVKQATYRWWGHSVGDYPLPAGFTTKDLGKCEYAIKIPKNNHAYEVGVVPSKTTAGEYELLFDFYAGGQGLMAKIGKDASLLTQQYKIETARKNLPVGFSIESTILPNGDVVLDAVKY